MARGLLWTRAVTSLIGRLALRVGAAILLAQAPVAHASPDLQGSVNGLFPMWEKTAILHPAGGGQVGHGHAQVGLGPAQIGTQPFLDLYGTFNLELKLALFAGGRHRTALVMGGYLVPALAEARALGDLHRPGFSNPYGRLSLFPVSLAHSFVASERLRVHSTLTGLFRYAEDPAD